MMTKGKAAVYYKYFNILSWYSYFDNVCFCVLEELEFIMRGRPFPFSFLLDMDKNILTSKLKKICILFCHEIPYLFPLISL